MRQRGEWKQLGRDIGAILVALALSSHARRIVWISLKRNYVACARYAAILFGCVSIAMGGLFLYTSPDISDNSTPRFYIEPAAPAPSTIETARPDTRDPARVFEEMFQFIIGPIGRGIFMMLVVACAGLMIFGGGESAATILAFLSIGLLLCVFGPILASFIAP